MAEPRIFKEATEFSQFIEQQAKQNDQTYLDIVLKYIEDRDVDYEQVKSLIAPSLKSKILKDYMDIGLIKPESMIDSEFFQ